jgi:hypothetical protein
MVVQPPTNAGRSAFVENVAKRTQRSQGGLQVNRTGQALGYVAIFRQISWIPPRQYMDGAAKLCRFISSGEVTPSFAGRKNDQPYLGEMMPIRATPPLYHLKWRVEE